MLEKKLNISTSRYSLLYSVYSLPNWIIPLISSFEIGWMGANKTLILHAAISFLGQSIFAMGGSSESFNTMLFGRFLFGAGSETLWVLQAVYINKWFYDLELSLAMGVCSLMPNVFSVLAGFLIPRLYKADGLGLAIGFGSIICMICFVLDIAMIILDMRMMACDK